LPLLENVLFEKKAIKLPKKSSLKYIVALAEKHDLYFGHDLADERNKYALKEIYKKIITSIENSSISLEDVVKNWPIIMKALRIQGRDPPNFMTINLIFFYKNQEDIIFMAKLIHRIRMCSDPFCLKLKMEEINGRDSTH
jgi:hypothetical protein